MSAVANENRDAAHQAPQTTAAVGGGPKPAIVKVTFFVTSPAPAHGGPNDHTSRRTQVWLSIALLPTTTPRDVIVAAFKHAIERLGGAKLDAHPAKMMIFLQSHGEFIKLDTAKQPLLEHEAVLELVRHEGKHVVTTALVSEAEFLRYNKQATTDPSPEMGQPGTRTERHDAALTEAASDKNSPSSSASAGAPPQGANGAGSGFQFRGRSRAASILPDALGHDPLADKRIRGKATNNSGLLPSASPPTATTEDDEGGHQGMLSNDSFMLPAHESRGPQLGKCRVEFVTPVGTRMSIIVEYPLGLLCHNVVDMAVAQFREGAKAAGREWELDEGLLDVTDALTLVYHCNGMHRRFGRNEVLPVSRGQRDEIVNLFLSVDRSLLVSSLHHKTAGASQRDGSVGNRRRSDSLSSLGSTNAVRPSVVLRIAGNAASLRGVAKTASGEHHLHPGDVGNLLKARFDACCIPLVESSLHADPSVGNGPSQPDVEAHTDERGKALLLEENAARIHLVLQQFNVAACKRDMSAVDVACSAAVEEEQRNVQRCSALQQAIGEAKSAERDIARLAELIEWFERDVAASKERQRDMTRELFELGRPPLQIVQQS